MAVTTAGSGVHPSDPGADVPDPEVQTADVGAHSPDSQGNFRIRTALWVAPVAELGGVARHVLDVVKTGIPGWRVIVLCPPGPLAEAIRALNGAVITGQIGPGCAGSSKASAQASIATLRRVAARLRPDIVHTHLAFADIVAVPATFGLRTAVGTPIRCVSTEHGIAADSRLYNASLLTSTAKRLAHTMRLRRFSCVIAVCESTKREILRQWGYGPGMPPVLVIPNGVDHPDPAPVPATGLRVLSLARLSQEKRIDRVIEAIAAVRQTHPEVRLTVAGIGEREHYLRDLAARLDLQGVVDFPGHIDARSALLDHDVVVQLSAWENCSYTLLDAVAYGLGVVATPVGGNPEIVPDRCLVHADDTATVAERLIAQGLDLSARPSPTSWRWTRAAMCARLSEEYDRLTGRWQIAP
ncbi:glycosyltransferase family 4 protein [Devriesea agamarum]|uniref:glycosyltransferase family 4 protein n=1 Tax=Devriesea agamarum TaxID=472569 RepID=UPI00071D361A|nr:glycosyltransferase family 4 protein [Devriesea agamarum]